MGARLSAVLEELGADAVVVVVDAGRLEAHVGEVLVGGVDEPVAQEPSGVLLLPGAETAVEPTLRTIRAAAGAGLLAVVVKIGSGAILDELAAAAQEAGVALLKVPAEMSWRHLDSLIVAARQAVDRDRAPLLDDGVNTGDVFGFANAVASAVGGAVMIEDAERRVVAYSNLPDQGTDWVRRQGILGRRALYGPSTDAMYRSVMDSEEAVEVPPPQDDVATRLAIAVRAGPRVVGTLWVISDRPALVPHSSRLLRDAARTAALHLLRARSRADPERDARSDALRALVSGTSGQHGLRRRLGLRRTQLVALLGVRVVEDDPRARLLTPKVDDVVSLYADFWHTAAPTTIDDDTIYALLPVDAESSRTRLRVLASDLVRAVHRATGVAVVAGVGPTASTLEEVPASRRTTDRLLAVLARGDVEADEDGSRVRLWEEARSLLLLQALSEQSVLTRELRLASVSAVLDHDREHGTEYARTLMVWCGAFGDAPRVAEELVVHDNTVRYRMRRLRELFAIDLDDPDDLLCTWLQLRLVLGRR